MDYTFGVRQMVRIRSVKPLAQYRVELTLTNGRKKIVDLEPYFRGPIFEPIRKSRTLFETVRVDGKLRTIVWDNGADIDPDVLTEGLKPAWMEEEDVRLAPKSVAVREPRSSYKIKRKKGKG